MSLTYADVELVVPDAALLAGIDEFMRVADIKEFYRPEWTGTSPNWKAPEFAGMCRDVQPGRLYWPRGASRWAIGHFLATEQQLDRIRQATYVADSRGVTSADLVIETIETDTENRIVAPMFMLPPRPLFQWEGDLGRIGTIEDAANLYLLTLVDDRYFWWLKSATLSVTASTTWTGLIAAIGTALGVTITVSGEIPDAYLNPAKDLTSKYDSLPLLLDAVAYSIGRRVVRTPSGSVILQSADDGYEAMATLANTYAEMANFGGAFRFLRASPHRDLPSLVPDTVRMVFPKHTRSDDDDPTDPCDETRCGAEVEIYDQTLQGLAIDQYEGVRTKRGVKTFKNTAIAWTGSSSSSSSGSSGSSGAALPANDAELSALTTQFARDWYTWQLGDQNRCLSGIIPWESDGMADFVEWEAFPRKVTRVVRETLNDLASHVFHATSPSGSSSSSSGSSSGSSGATCYRKFGELPISSIPGYSGSVVQLLGHDASGCLTWYSTEECP